MDYEQKYKEALDWMRSVYPTMTGANKEDAEHFFPELKESENERIRNWLIGYFRQYKEDGVEKYANGLKVESIITWLEKQGEQKTSDKTEPKFKVGDILVSDEEDRRHIYKVDAITNYDTYLLLDLEDGYTRNEPTYTSDLAMYLWAIQDVKDGDVLSDGNTIFIFKDLLSDCSVMSYCDYDTNSGESDAFCPLSMNLVCSKITPATKEQRDLLFQKMKEAGYEWDKKNGLKKIEHNSAEEYSFNIESKLFHQLTQAQQVLWRKEIEQAYNAGADTQKPAERSEEDKKMFVNIKACLRNANKDYSRELDWLKSLRPQTRWKPSDEQMKQLDWIAKQNKDNMIGKELMTLYNDLKKLTE